MLERKLQPRTVDQILYVLAKYKGFRHLGFGPIASYHEAVAKTSSKFQVTYQTIGDACRRRLDLDNIGEFLILLRKWWEGDSEELIILLTKYANSIDRRRIINFFSDNGKNVNSMEIEEEEIDETISLHFEKETIKKLKTLSGADGISVSAWLRKEIIKMADEKVLEWMRIELEKLNPKERSILLKGII